MQMQGVILFSNWHSPSHVLKCISFVTIQTHNYKKFLLSCDSRVNSVINTDNAGASSKESVATPLSWDARYQKALSQGNKCVKNL